MYLRALVQFEIDATFIKEAYRTPEGSSAKHKLIGYLFAGDMSQTLEIRVFICKH